MVCWPFSDFSGPSHRAGLNRGCDDRGNDIRMATRMTVRCPSERNRRQSTGKQMSLAFWSSFNTRGCRIFVSVRLPVRPLGETMYLQANANIHLFCYPPFKAARSNSRNSRDSGWPDESHPYDCKPSCLEEWLKTGNSRKRRHERVQKVFRAVGAKKPLHWWLLSDGAKDSW